VEGGTIMDLHYHEVHSENKGHTLWASDVYTAYRDLINYSEVMKELGSHLSRILLAAYLILGF
jgi:hypothetical protein